MTLFIVAAYLTFDRPQTYAASNWILPASSRSLCAGMRVTADASPRPLRIVSMIVASVLP
jgi:hypothetical protein